MKWLLFTACILIYAAAGAQQTAHDRYLEAGFLFGVHNYSGDVAEKLVEIAETRPGYGFFARYHISSRIALRTHFYTGNITGTDAHASDPELAARSLRFSSNLVELSLLGEWNFLNITPQQENGISRFRIVPYFFLGAGGVFASSRVEYFGPPQEMNRLLTYPLPEEGLNPATVVMPFGLGFRAGMLDRITLGLEGGWRPVFSDDLDGVSLNGDPGQNDWYHTITGTLSFELSR